MFIKKQILAFSFRVPVIIAFTAALAYSQDPISERINEKRGITVTTDGSVTEAEAKQFAKEIKLADSIVSEFLVTTYDGDYRVDISTRHITSRALIHVWAGNRGFVEFPTRNIKRQNAAIVHEVTHIIAPNYNRFLAEGLAVYTQERFQKNNAPPILSKDLHQGTAQQDVISLDDLIRETKDTFYYWSKAMSTTPENRNAYFHAGSLVKFLLENEYFGKEEKAKLEKFKRLYELANEGIHGAKIFDVVYGIPMKEVEKMWRSYLKTQ